VEALRLLLVDDETLVRTGLRLLLDGAEGITVVGEAGDGVDALVIAEQTRPDVVLLDIRMPRLDGIGTTGQLLARWPELKVIVLTTFNTDATVIEALRLGAVGFLLKDTEPTELVSAIVAAHQGRLPLSPQVTRQLVAHATAAPAPRERAVAALASLTERERAIAVAVASGATNAEIAAAQYVSVATVKTQLSAAMAKLNATNRVQVALRCYEAGLI
jgi:DNA-binding NarL/FixJ family response regulator